LIKALQKQLKETDDLVKNVKKVFKLNDKKPAAKKCRDTAGLLKESGEITKDTDKGGIFNGR